MAAFHSFQGSVDTATYRDHIIFNIFLSRWALDGFRLWAVGNSAAKTGVQPSLLHNFHLLWQQSFDYSEELL